MLHANYVEDCQKPEGFNFSAEYFDAGYINKQSLSY